jgi:FolB domain-containing protein
MVVRIKNLKLQAIIGVNDWERREQQEIIVNIEAEFDASRACATDNINDAVDYSALEQDLAAKVQASRFFLLEKLADFILGIVMSDGRIIRASVEVDKPRALPSADSVSISVWAKR